MDGRTIEEFSDFFAQVYMSPDGLLELENTCLPYIANMKSDDQKELLQSVLDKQKQGAKDA